jgi:hypothetical protein
MDITALKIDLSTYRTPLVVWERDMFVPDDAIYTNNVGYLQTSEDVFFTGTVFDPDIRSLKEYSEGLEHGRESAFSKEGILLYEKIYINGRFIGAFNANDGKIMKFYNYDKELLKKWIMNEGKYYQEKFFQANHFKDE